MGLHEVLAKQNFSVEASEVLSKSQARFVMYLVEREFISKVNS